jgi:hypothetical protein
MYWPIVGKNCVSSPESTCGVLLTGEAGVGKSGVILQVIESLQEQGLPLITFRVDRLDPTILPSDVGQQLGLPDSPVNVLAAIAQGQDCPLVIDQLDATSLASGRNPQFFDCIDEILKQARAYPRMHLNTFGQEAGDVRTRHAADADTVCRLTVRVYSQTRDEGLQTRCLDVIDRMVQTRAFGFEKTLALYDR